MRNPVSRVSARRYCSSNSWSVIATKIGFQGEGLIFWRILDTRCQIPNNPVARIWVLPENQNTRMSGSGIRLRRQGNNPPNLLRSDLIEVLLISTRTEWLGNPPYSPKSPTLFLAITGISYFNNLLSTITSNPNNPFLVLTSTNWNEFNSLK